jgi:hypothetical protein
LSRIQQLIDTLEAERAEVQKHLAWIEQQIKEFHAYSGGSAAATPARSVRRATARRASTRRATARSRQGDTKASIIDFLAQHPGSTAGDLAKGLNLNPGSVSSRLTQLAKSGEIKKHHAATAQNRRRDPADTSAHPVAHTEPAWTPRTLRKKELHAPPCLQRRMLRIERRRLGLIACEPGLSSSLPWSRWLCQSSCAARGRTSCPRREPARVAGYAAFIGRESAGWPARGRRRG